MAIFTTLNVSKLEPGFILSPERYDPRRRVKTLIKAKPLSELVEIMSQTINPHKVTGSLLVLDTSDVKEGFITSNKKLTTEIGSTKKIAFPGDVLISKLRPYLKQVGFVAKGLGGDSIQILVSTEFYILRANDQSSIAFLVPYLLSDPIQNALSASQEGGHHPRFDTHTLASLPVPEEIIDRRDTISEQIEQAAQMRITSSLIVDSEIRKLTKSLE